MSTAEIDVVEQMEKIKHDLSYEESDVKVADVTPGSSDKSESVKVNGNHDAIETACEESLAGLPEARKPEETVQVADPIQIQVLASDNDVKNPEQLSETVVVVDNGETEASEHIETVRVVEECDLVQIENQNREEAVEKLTPLASESILVHSYLPAVETVTIETPSQEFIVENGDGVEIADSSSDKLESIPQEVASDEPAVDSLIIENLSSQEVQNGDDIKISDLSLSKSEPQEVQDEPAADTVNIKTPSREVENGDDIEIADFSKTESLYRDVVEDAVLVVEPSKYGIFKPKIKIAMPKLKLLNGETMPVFGLGTWQSSSEDVERAVRVAIDCGYRHIDCAYVYKNEKAVGEAIAAKIAEGVVKREELFICTKLWNTDHEPKDVEKACRRSLELLGLDYLDLYLMHTPMGFKSGTQLLPKIAGVIQYSPVDYLDTWYAMEELVSAGLTKSIGVSNFNISQLERLWSKAKIKPVTNQVECHPFLNQQKMSSWCAINGVVLTAYSSLGSGSPASYAETSEVLIDNQVVKNIARKYGRSPAQILLRYQIERGHATIPKSVTASRIQENIGALEFQLKPEDVYSLNQLNKNKRYVPFVGFGDTHKDYPFNSPN